MEDIKSWVEYIKQYKKTPLKDFIKKGNRYLFDNHHLEPIALHWHDKMYNIVQLRRPMHDHIHDVLNIPQNNYHSLKRKEREKSNHKLIDTPEYVKFVDEMQKRYFKNYWELMEVERVIHDNKMRDIVQHRQSVADEFLNYDVMKNPESFHVMHNHKNVLRYEIAKEIQDTMKKKYYR